MGRVYDHVMPEMERQILEALEQRFLSFVLALDDAEREKLLAWVPVDQGHRREGSEGGGEARGQGGGSGVPLPKRSHGPL
jgi:hypothetical protein